MIIFPYISLIIGLQATGSKQPPPPPVENRPPLLPIDDALWILIVAGILLGIYFLYKRRQAINKNA